MTPKFEKLFHRLLSESIFTRLGWAVGHTCILHIYWGCPMVCTPVFGNTGLFPGFRDAS